MYRKSDAIWAVRSRRARAARRCLTAGALSGARGLVLEQVVEQGAAAMSGIDRDANALARLLQLDLLGPCGCVLVLQYALVLRGLVRAAAARRTASRSWCLSCRRRYLSFTRLRDLAMQVRRRDPLDARAASVSAAGSAPTHRSGFGGTRDAPCPLSARD